MIDLLFTHNIDRYKSLFLHTSAGIQSELVVAELAVDCCYFSGFAAVSHVVQEYDRTFLSIHIIRAMLSYIFNVSMYH
jgi:hypothetical protein